MKFLAVLKDSLYETIDQKLFYVLLAVSLVLVLVCASFSFQRLPVAEVLQNHYGNTVTISEVQVVDEPTFGSQGRYRFTITPAEGDLPPPRQERAGRREVWERSTYWSLSELTINPVAPLRTGGGFTDPMVLESEKDKDGKLKRAVAEVTFRWPEIFQSHELVILFGLHKTEMLFPVGGTVTAIQVAIVDYLAGWVGVTIAVICTAGFVPNMMRKGSIDLLLVRPIPRPILLLYKYLGGLLFVALNAAFLVGASWVVFGFTMNNWNPWYLASVGVLMFYFAVLYSLSVLIGVLTQSSLAAILVTLGFWIFMAVVNMVYVLAHDDRSQIQFPQYVVTALDAIHFVMPRLSDLSALNQRALLEANGMSGVLNQELRQAALRFSWTEALATSFGFIVVMLGLACWRFTRRDY
ncbi:MAG: ABC transporter permease [Gemmatales bacterium]|nr:ABC transporter permease [Gemmatales bacterium]MDW8386902.1 ABC transporter permease subunit [Gemmatales bacterium]